MERDDDKCNAMSKESTNEKFIFPSVLEWPPPIYLDVRKSTKKNWLKFIPKNQIWKEIYSHTDYSNIIGMYMLIRSMQNLYTCLQFIYKEVILYQHLPLIVA